MVSIMYFTRDLTVLKTNKLLVKLCALKNNNMNIHPSIHPSVHPLSVPLIHQGLGEAGDNRSCFRSGGGVDTRFKPFCCEATVLITHSTAWTLFIITFFPRPYLRLMPRNEANPSKKANNSEAQVRVNTENVSRPNSSSSPGPSSSQRAFSPACVRDNHLFYSFQFNLTVCLKDHEKTWQKLICEMINTVSMFVVIKCIIILVKRFIYSQIWTSW